MAAERQGKKDWGADSGSEDGDEDGDSDGDGGSDDEEAAAAGGKQGGRARGKSDKGERLLVPRWHKGMRLDLCTGMHTDCMQPIVRRRPPSYHWPAASSKAATATVGAHCRRGRASRPPPAQRTLHISSI